MDWIAGMAPWGPVLFIAIHVLATIALRPRIGARAKGEAVFGVAWGSVYGSIASIRGASCAVLVGPYLARDANARKID